MIEQLSMVDLSMQEYLSVEKIKEILIEDFGYSAEDIQYCSGIMGVPITFLDKYNPEQFEIIGNEYILNIEKGRGYVNGKRMYSRVFIQKKEDV